MDVSTATAAVVQATEYSDMSRIIASNVPIVILLGILGFAVMGKMFDILWKQHKEIQTQKEKVDESELARVADRIGDLVEQIKFLFAQRENDTEEIEGIKERVSDLEKGQGEQHTRCDEREKAVADKIKVLHRRLDDPQTHDRSDRGD